MQQFQRGPAEVESGFLGTRRTRRRLQIDGRRAVRVSIRVVSIVESSLAVRVMITAAAAAILVGRSKLLLLFGRCAHVRTVRVAVPVVHQRDGGMVGEVAAAGTRRRAQTVRVLAQDDAEGGRRTAAHSAGQRRLLELARALVHFAPAGCYLTAWQGCATTKIV